jgi:hypothetical protein
MGGSEGRKAVGEGPCDPSTDLCQNASTEGTTGPVACPTNDANSGALCEFSDASCFPKGNRVVTVNGVAAKEHAPRRFSSSQTRPRLSSSATPSPAWAAT